MSEELLSRAERYFDGLMQPAEARTFEAELKDSPELLAELAALRDTRELLQVYVTERVDRVDFGGFFSAIEEQLPTEAPAAREPASQPARPAAPGAVDRLKAWWVRYWTPVLVSTAAAAAVAFLVTRAAAPTPEIDDGERVVAGLGVDVEEVNNDGPRTVLISMPVDDDDEVATVIWLLDEEVDEEDGADALPDGEDPI